MKRFFSLMLALVLLAACLPTTAMAKAKQMEDDVPVWTEETVRQYALDFISGRHMDRLWGYYDLQIRRYMPPETYKEMLTDLEWLTGAFIELGSYRTFSEPERQLQTHVLHLCMEKQDLDMYFTHKDKEDDWEVMALEFVFADDEPVSDSRDMLVEGDGSVAEPSYLEEAVSVGDAKQPLEGILTLPEGASASSPVPACVLLHDMSGLDRDATQGNTKMFRDLAIDFAGMGVATLRYDTRAYTYPDAQFETVREEAVMDGVSAMQLLAKDERVDAKRIAVLGVGFGATVAPRVANEANVACAGIMLIGGRPDSLAAQALKAHADEVAAMKEKDAAELQFAVRSLGYKEEAEARKLTLFGRNGYYYWEMEKNDPVKLIEKLRLPTYIAQGKQDPILTEKECIEAYKNKVGPHNGYITFKSFRGLNHLLMPDTTTPIGQTPTYERAVEVDTQAARELALWILNLK